MAVPVLVLDIGKTNARAFVFDAAGAAVWERRATFAAPPVTHGYRALPIDAMLSFVEQALVAAAALGARSVIPVTHGAAVALVDRDGLVLPVLDYEDASPETLAGYDAERPAFAEIFSPALPHGLNLGRQLAWLEHTFPHDFARAEAFLTLPQFIGWHLSGVAAGEVTSLGCHSDLWSPLRHDFSSLVDARGWRARLPAVRPAASPLGPLRLALAAPMTVLNGLHDSNASLSPHLGAGEATIVSTGTWFVAMAPGGTLDPALPAARDCLANVDVHGRAYPCARFMGGREFAALAGGSAPTLADAPAVAESIARGRMIMPNHAPGGGPFPGAAGTAPADASPAEATLYLALMTATCIELIGAQGPIVIEGPAAANPLYAALLQALHPDRAVGVARDTDATARGAAQLTLGITRSPATTPAMTIVLPGLAAYAREWRAAAEARITA